MHLPENFIPRLWRCFEKFPLLANGKLDRQQLHLVADRMEHHTQQVTHQIPITDEEIVIHDAWTKHLNHDQQISVEDNYFALGGDSIIALSICAELRSLDYQVSPRLFYKYRNCQEFSSSVDS